MNMMRNVPGRVRRRHVFFIPGYDPRGARFYYKLYKDEAPAQNRHNGLSLEVGPRGRGGDFETCWQVSAADSAGPIETTYHFLIWDDLVRARWTRSLFAIYLEIWRAFWSLLVHGVYYRTLRSSWPMFITGIYPPGFMALHFIIAAAAGALGFYLVSPWLGTVAGVIAGLLAAASLFTFRKKLEERYNALWLGRIIKFIADQGQDRTGAVDRRCEDFARLVMRASRDKDCDEILIIGHSIGSHLAVSTLARCLDGDPEVAQRGPVFGLLTLGHMIPTVAMQRRAKRFSDDLSKVAGEKAINWIDMTSPIDGASMALTDPVTASRLSHADPRNPRPKLLNPRFHKLFTPERYKFVRRHFKRAHLQYMMASELAGDYDYFAITAGPLTLAERYREHESVDNFNRFRWGLA